MSLILTVLAFLVRLACLGLALAAAAVGVLALGGARSLRLDVLTHFAPITLALGLGALVAHFATRPGKWWPTPFLATAAVAASAYLMAPDIIAALRPSPAPPAHGQTLKLVQFNLWEHNADPAATARWIASQDADVVVLEEVTGAAKSIPEALKALYPYQVTCQPPYPCSTVILARSRPSALGGMNDPDPHVTLPGAWARFGDGPSAYTVVGVHLRWPIPAGPQQAQSRRVARLLNGFDRPNVIVAGDFNSTPWSFAMRRQDARFGLERRTHAMFTWPAAPFTDRRLVSPVPFLAIDQVYAGSAWKTVSVRRGPREPSDHFPVVVVLRRVNP